MSSSSSSSSWNPLSLVGNAYRSSKEFVRRHKWAFGITASVGAMAGGYTAYKKWWPAWVEIRDQLKLIEQMESTGSAEQKEMAQKELAQYFDNTMRICDATVYGFVGDCRKQIMHRFDVETLHKQLRSGQATNKLELWSELKVCAFSRCLLMVYTAAFLACLCRAMLSIIARHHFILSKTQAQTEEQKRAFESQQKKFLLIASHVSEAGIAQLADIIQAAVDEATSQTTLKTQCQAPAIRDMFVSARRQADAHVFSSKAMELILLPPHVECSDGEDVLREMSAELRRLVSCESFARVVSQVVDSGMDCLTQNVAVIAPKQPVPFAKMIPVVVKAFRVLSPSRHVDPSGGAGASPEVLLNALASVAPLHELCRVIYFPLPGQELPVPQGPNAMQALQNLSSMRI